MKISGFVLRPWAIVVIAVLLQPHDKSFAPTFEFREEGRLFRPEVTAHLLELVRLRGNDEVRAILAGRPQYRELVNVLSRADLGLMTEYDRARAETNPTARREAFERLHQRFWEVMDRQAVRDALRGAGNTHAVSTELGNILHDFSTDSRTEEAIRGRLQASVNFMRYSLQHRAVISQTMRAAEARGGIPGRYTREVDRLHNGDARPTPEAYAALTRMFNDAREAMSEHGLNGRPQLTAEERVGLQHAMDYVLLHENPADIQQSAQGIIGMLRTDGGALALRGVEAFTRPTVEGTRTFLLEEGGRLGLLDGPQGLRAKARERLRTELSREPSAAEVDAAISARELKEEIEAAILRGESPTARLAEFRERFENNHDRLFLEQLARLSQQPGRQGLLRQLLNARRRPPCLSRRLITACARHCGRTAAGIGAFTALAYLGPAARGEEAPPTEAAPKGIPDATVLAKGPHDGKTKAVAPLPKVVAPIPND